LISIMVTLLRMGPPLLLLLLFGFSSAATTPSRPSHILAFLVDDYGWDDAGWHSKNTEVKTPVMDSLVAEGIELDR